VTVSLQLVPVAEELEFLANRRNQRYKEELLLQSLFKKGGEYMHLPKRKRRILMKDVKDPLEQHDAVAWSARTQQRVNGSKRGDASSNSEESVAKTPPFHKKRNLAHWLLLTSDESEEEGKTLSMLPAKYKLTERAKPSSAIQVSAKAGSDKKRAKCTEEEDKTIRDGVNKNGFGKWARINAHHCRHRRNRSAVQIKDRARTHGITHCHNIRRAG
jgi:hypothetical protein